MTTVSPNTIAADIEARTGANVFLCYQCKKCTLGCPLSHQMDLQPNQIMRLLQLGRIDEALGSRTVWVCSSCQTCTTRCPMDIDIAHVMDELKIKAQEQHLEPKLPAALDFINSGMRSIRGSGRMHELGLMLEMNLKAGKPFRDARMGLKMLRSGRLRLLPERAGFPRKLKPRERPASPKQIAYYPGCSLHASGSEYDTSFKAVAGALGLTLVEPKGWMCCGSTPAHWKSREVALEMPLKNLSLIESEGHSAVTVPCAMCFSRLRRAAHDVEMHPELTGPVAAQTGYTYGGKLTIENAVDSILNRAGLDAIAARVKKPASGLKVASYYGCLLTRPPRVTGTQHPEYPMNMDLLMQSVGAIPVDWSFKTDCCGGSMGIIDVDTCLGLVKKILDDAVACGADLIVSACPMCQNNLDSRQPALSRREGKDYKVPVLYFTQLLALCMGLGEKNADVEGHMVEPKGVLRKKGLVV
ncbi:MAG: 4Fe-4S dicluster domain-containing protein [Chloroflexi bacterium]|nr:4Fe-4S dicluster domain-containing protein [Chloroflexota bacterium]